MDIKELNKTQLVWLTLLITFVVSIGTGIVTVSLMQQMPQSVPQTINNVIQRTIEKVSVPAAPETKPDSNTTKDEDNAVVLGSNDALISIYPVTPQVLEQIPAGPALPAKPEDPKALGQGVIVSDIGLVLVDSGILGDATMYRVILDKKEFTASILKKFDNGFTILKISPKETAPESGDTKTQNQQSTVSDPVSN
ncbi:MAG: hypothetical protein V4665_02625 [Patescibacteria group bacterium]